MPGGWGVRTRSGPTCSWPLFRSWTAVQRPAGAGGANAADAPACTSSTRSRRRFGGHGVARLRAAAWQQQASIGVLGVLVVGAILRTLRLDTFPPVFYADVAANGIDALRLPQHGLQAIYAREPATGRGHDRIGSMPSVRPPGRQTDRLYLTTVVVGLVTSPFITCSPTASSAVARPDQHGAAGSLFLRSITAARLPHGPRPALSRLAFLLLWWAVQRGSAWRWALAGAVDRLGAYTIRVRLIVLVLAVDRPPDPCRARAAGSRLSWALYALAATVVMAPLGSPRCYTRRVLNRGRRGSVLGGGPSGAFPPARRSHLARDRGIQPLGRCRAPVQRATSAVRSVSRARLPCRDRRRLQAMGARVVTPSC